MSEQSSLSHQSLMFGWADWLVGRYLVSEPALWGKLPSHADFVSLEAKQQEIEGWRRWLARHAPPEENPDRHRSRPRSGSGIMWLGTETASAKAWLRDVPVVFVLPPGELAFSGKRYVVGVMVLSSDALGRPHPLIIYQTASLTWVRQHWLERIRPLPGQRPALPFLPRFNTRTERLAPPAQDWFFWLARLLGRYVHLQTTQSSDATTLQHFCRLMQELWGMHKPGLLHIFLRQREHPRLSEVVLQEWLNTEFEAGVSDAAEGLHGARHMPWPDWPACMWGGTPSQRATDGRQEPASTRVAEAAFWQQDGQGGYVNAAHVLARLWKQA